MRTNRTRAAFGAAALVLLALAGCADEPTSARRSGPDPLLETLVRMGFARDQIVDAGDHFVVEGDMLFDKAGLRTATVRDGKAHPGQPSFQRYASLVGSNRRTIRVNLSSVDAVSSSWASAVRAAMSNWNGAPGTGYQFVEGGTTDVTVTTADLAFCVAANAYVPSNGAPGHTLTINSDHLLSPYTYAQKVWVITHELGHIIGFEHTDETYGTKISGTPDSDAGSVLNSGPTYGGCPPDAPAWSSLSYYDQYAARWMYPATLSATAAYPSGSPTVSWNHVGGTSYYKVYYVKDQFYVGAGTWQRVEQSVGTTSSLSLADPNRSYTGMSMCEIRGTVQGGIEEYYGYRVESNWGSGYTYSTVIPAETGDC